LLEQLGLAFEVVAPDIDETFRTNEPPAQYVERLAREKVAAIRSQRRGTVVLAADTSVVVDGEILGKPGPSREMGETLLHRLSGRTHQVMTGVAVSGLDMTQQHVRSLVVSSEVVFRPLSEREVTWYVATGEGRDKAGGYAMQGRGGAFISSITGSVSSVIGLPLAETVALLAWAGISMPWDAGR
jgi:septum formation protein